MSNLSCALRILYAEDNPTDADLARRALARWAPESTLEVVSTLGAAFERLASAASDYDVVLADLRLPDGSGLELLGYIRAHDLPLAVVMLTGSGDQVSAIAALKAGVDDYLVKDGDYLDRLAKTLATAHTRFHESSGGRAGSLRVLYLEHNIDDLDLTRRHLADHAPHIRLQAATSGAEMLGLLPSPSTMASPYDVLLLDFQLPDADALELVKTLRDERGLDLPVVLIGSEGSEEVVARALRLGVVDYLVKHSGYLFELPVTLEKAARLAQLQREQAALRDSEQCYRLLEERFRIFFEGALDGILLADTASRRFVIGNPAICRMLGYSQEEITCLGVQDIHPAESLAQVLVQFEQQVRGECQGAPDTPVRRKDGSVFYADINASLVQLDGKPCLMGIFRDITRRKAAEERLRLHAAALAGSRDAVIITDLVPAILAVNPSFTEITGYSEEEVMGKDPRFLSSGRHERDFFQGMWANLLQGGYWQGEIWNRRKGGEVYPVLLSISTVRNEQGMPTHYVGVMTDLSSIRQSEAQLQYLTHYDPLTRLPNRLLLEARLAHTLERAEREGRRAAVLVIDLDQFKTINDSLGHAAGDDLLVTVAARLASRLREEDTLSRLAGDEFALVLESIHDYQEAERMACRIQNALEEPFTLPDGDEAYVRASIGICVYPQDGDTAQTLLARADAAVHRAKDLGGSQFCYASSELNLRARAALSMETALRRALEQGEFLLHYQPKVDLGHGRIVGVEALLRWQRPGHGMVPPLEFIPTAEKSGLIVAIGAWVIEEACRQIRRWCEAGLPDIRVAVNVSARQFRSGNLERVVTAALERHGVAPQHLTLELTESMLMEHPDEVINRLAVLKGIGVQLSLDDFGTGYSSFSYLSRFPIDQIKIDRSFISDIAQDPDAAAIVVAIIGLAHRMRIRVVAEGVETEAQLGYLRQNGCEEMQGYLFSKPVSAAEFVELLNRGRTLPVQDEPRDQHTLLIVDDESNIHSALKRVLVDEGYRVLTAGSAQEGLELLAKNVVQVILSDQCMPVMCGIDFLGRVKTLYPDTVRMVLSGYAELETVVEAVNEGAIYKFLIKPWKDDQLREHIRDAFLYYEAIIKPRQLKSLGSGS